MADINEAVQTQKIGSNARRVDYARALSWFFTDPQFGRVVLVGSLYLLSCILILPLFYVAPVLWGYILDLISNIQKGRWELPLLGAEGQWQKGVKYMLVQLMLAVAIVILSMVILFGFGALIETSYGSTQTILGFFGVLLYFALVLGASLLLYFQFIIFAKTDDISSMFSMHNLGYVLKKNIGAMIIASIIFYAAANIYPLIGMAACGIGILPAVIVLYMTMASLFGQLDVDGVE